MKVCRHKIPKSDFACVHTYTHFLTNERERLPFITFIALQTRIYLFLSIFFLSFLLLLSIDIETIGKEGEIPIRWTQFGPSGDATAGARDQEEIKFGVLLAWLSIGVVRMYKTHAPLLSLRISTSQPELESHS